MNLTSMLRRIHSFLKGRVNLRSIPPMSFGPRSDVRDASGTVSVLSWWANGIRNSAYQVRPHRLAAAHPSTEAEGGRRHYGRRCNDCAGSRKRLAAIARLVARRTLRARSYPWHADQFGCLQSSPWRAALPRHLRSSDQRRHDPRMALSSASVRCVGGGLLDIESRRQRRRCRRRHGVRPGGHASRGRQHRRRRLHARPSGRRQGEPVVIDYRETAPAAATKDHVRTRTTAATATRLVGVPGTVRGLALAHQAVRQAALEGPRRCRPSSWPRRASPSTTTWPIR